MPAKAVKNDNYEVAAMLRDLQRKPATPDQGSPLSLPASPRVCPLEQFRLCLAGEPSGTQKRRTQKQGSIPLIRDLPPCLSPSESSIAIYNRAVPIF